MTAGPGIQLHPQKLLIQSFTFFSFSPNLIFFLCVFPFTAAISDLVLKDSLIDREIINSNVPIGVYECMQNPENIGKFWNSWRNFGLQDNVRNQLIQVELLLTTVTLILAIFGIVVGIFGMKFPIRLFDEPGAFKWVLIITSIGGINIFCAFVWFFKCKRTVSLY